MLAPCADFSAVLQFCSRHFGASQARTDRLCSVHCGGFSALTQPLRGISRHERLAALLIAAAALLEVVLITHHPIAHTAAGDAPFAGIKGVINANLFFHSVLMMVLVGQLVGVVLFARVLRLERAMVVAGLILCILASVMLAVAMTFDGFVTHDLVALCTASAHGCTGTTAESLQIILATTSAFSKVGFGAQCLGYAGLSVAMWAPGLPVRLAAVMGFVFSIAPIALIALEGGIGPSGLFKILSFLAAWGLCVAAVLASGIISDRPAHASSPLGVR